MICSLFQRQTPIQTIMRSVSLTRSVNQQDGADVPEDYNPYKTAEQVKSFKPLNLGEKIVLDDEKSEERLD